MVTFAINQLQKQQLSKNTPEVYTFDKRAKKIDTFHEDFSKNWKQRWKKTKKNYDFHSHSVMIFCRCSPSTWGGNEMATRD